MQQDIDSLPQRYDVSDAAIAEMRKQFLPLVIQSPEDKQGAKRVREARLTVKSTRVAVEKTRKALKEDALRYGQAVDAEARRLTALLTPIEEHLEAQEAAMEAEVKRRATEAERQRIQRLEMRMASLRALESPLLRMDVEAMTDEQFDAALSRAAVDYQALLVERTRKADEEAAARAAQEEAQAAERQRLAAEQAQLAAERARLEEERQRAEAAVAAARQQLEEERAAVRREQEARAAEERAKAEEQLRIERAAQEEREAAAAAASLAGDRGQLLAFAGQIEDVPMPVFDNIGVRVKVRNAVVHLVTYLRSEAAKIK